MTTICEASHRKEVGKVLRCNIDDFRLKRRESNDDGEWTYAEH